MAGSVLTDIGVSAVEDVTDMIFQITPEETVTYNLLGETNDVDNIYHQWQTRDLVTRNDNAKVEGRTFQAREVRGTSRETNICQIFGDEIRISGTSQAVKRYAISDQFADQMKISMTEVKTDMNHAIVQGSLASVTTTGQRRFNGIIWSLSLGTGNHTVLTVASLGEDLLMDLLQENWDRGVRAKDVLVNAREKRAISAFTAGVTKFRDQEDRRVVNAVSIYESDFGIVQIHLERDVPSNTTIDVGGVDFSNSSFVIAIDRSFWKKAWLRRPFTEMTAKVADSIDGALTAEFTLEYGNPNAGGWKVIPSLVPTL